MFKKWSEFGTFSMKCLLLFFISLSSLSLFGQKRLELLETNIPVNTFTTYADSYLWTKNWWLTSGMVIDTGKGGNTLSVNSKLSKLSIDSLSKEFQKFLSPKVIRFGNLTPRIIYVSTKKRTPFIKASIYEIEESSSQLIAAYTLEFGSGKHNGMADVANIIIFDPKAAIPIAFKTANTLYTRKASKAENEMTPPKVTKQ